MKEYTLIPLPIGKIRIDKSMMTYRMNMGQVIEIPYFSWYIQGADKHILVDTGIEAKDQMALDAPGAPQRFFDIRTFEDSLGSLGLRPEDIDY